MKTGAFRLARVSKVRNHVRGEICMTEQSMRVITNCGEGVATVYPGVKLPKYTYTFIHLITANI